jgi:putative membrane protein
VPASTPTCSRWAPDHVAACHLHGVAQPRTPLTVGANYVRGALMGAADVIPGVSGGTVALILGIYARLISSIRAAASAPVAILRGDLVRARARWTEVDWWLVVPLGVGILTAIAVGTVVLPGLLDRYPEGTRALFFGLIAASVPIPWRQMRERRRGLLVAVIFAAFAFVLVGLPPQTIEDPALVYVFVAASIAICAMILPGVSGAFLLYALGVYRATLEAVRDLDIIYVVVFGAGAVIGLGLFSKLLEWLFAHRHDATMAALVGLMAGSLRALWPWQDDDRGLLTPPTELSTLVLVGLVVVGFAVVTVLVRVSASREEPSTP